MTRTELSSFSHCQIFTQIAYLDLSRNLENLTNFDICKTVKL